MKKVLSLVLCFVLVAVMALPVFAAEYTVGDDGNAVYDNAHGYVFGVDSVNGTVNETVVVLNSQEAFDACASVWSIYILLNKVEENVYVAAEDAFVAKGSKPAYTLGEGDIVLVSHSSSSRPTDAETYPNWQDKVAAVAVKAGDYFTFSGVDFAAGTVAEGATAACTAEKPAAPGGETVLVKGDNIAGDYTITDQFRQGGQDVGWGWDENAPIAYPDEGGTLTDGKVDTDVTENIYADAVWAGFSYLLPTYKDVGYHAITLDLGEAKDIYEMAIYLGTSALTAGIGVSNSTVQFFASDDGENWEAISEELVPEDDATVNVVRVASEVSANAKYVQVRFARDGWLFVSEVEVYEAVPASEDVVLETITVDGDLSDNGWAADKWTSVNADNGTFQGGSDSLKNAVSSSFSYKFQMRADETKLYVAAVYDCSIVEVDDSGRGTKFRLWIHNGDEACVAYTHFYDIYMKNGEIVLAAKENFPTAEKVNNASDIENSTLVGAMKEVDGKTYFEMSVDLAEFVGAEGFNYFFNAGHKTVDGENVDNIQMLYPAVPVPEDSKNANFPYTKWYAENDAVCDVEAIKLGVVSGDTDDNLGDAGIYAIASLALVALIGTAVVIKKRA